MNVGHILKRQMLFQRLEVKMSQLMNLVRGPALGVVVMILLLAGVLIVTAFAALIAQMSLQLRLKPWNTSDKSSSRETSDEQGTVKGKPQRATGSEHQDSPQVVVIEPNVSEVVDAVWWQEVW
jgi:hypothetical protein